MESWYSNLLGSLEIQVEGARPERFVDGAAAVGVRLWGIRRIARSRMTACLLARDFARLRKVAKGSGCRVRILRRRGLSFFLAASPWRKGLVMGAAFFLAAGWLCGSLVWSVDIVGDKTLPQADILAVLAENGAHTGAFRSAIHPEELEYALLTSDLPLTWAGVSLRGTQLVVEVVRENVAPQLEDISVPCRIVAKKDALVISVLPEQGLGVALPGQTVRAGQELIAGYIPVENREPLLEHARGEVLGRVWYEADTRTALETTQWVESGRSATRKLLHLGGMTAAVEGTAAPAYENCRSESVRYPLFGTGEAVAYYEVITDYERVQQRVVGDRATLEKQAQLEVWELIKGEIPSDALIVSRKFEHVAEGNELITRVSVETREDIGQAVPLEAVPAPSPTETA